MNKTKCTVWKHSDKREIDNLSRFRTYETNEARKETFQSMDAKFKKAWKINKERKQE